MRFGDFQVNLRANDENLPEYGEVRAVKDGLATVSCWIPSEAGKVCLPLSSYVVAAFN